MVSDFFAEIGAASPIVLGPFGGLSSVALAAAVSDAGGLGSYGLYGYDGARIRATADELRAATRGRFALNIWLPVGDEVEPLDVDVDAAASALAPFFAAAGVPVPTAPAQFLPTLEDQVTAVLDAAPTVLSVVFGVPSAELLAAAHGRGIRVVGTATSVAEAIALDRAGVDAIVATGMEAGGHRVSFLAPAEESLIGLFALLPQVVDAVTVPVIAAGGIADRRGVAAAFALGASGVQVGSAFLRTQESAAPPSHRSALAASTDSSTVLTRALSGRLARGIPNRALREIEAADAVAPFPAQNWLTGVFRRAAGAQDNAELLSLWGGQSAGLSRFDTAAEVFAELAAGLPKTG